MRYAIENTVGDVVGYLQDKDHALRFLLEIEPDGYSVFEYDDAGNATGSWVKDGGALVDIMAETEFEADEYMPPVDDVEESQRYGVIESMQDTPADKLEERMECEAKYIASLYDRVATDLYYNMADEDSDGCLYLPVTTESYDEAVKKEFIQRLRKLGV